MTASIESFLRSESTEELIARCVKSSINPDAVQFHRADSFSAARSLDETERLMRIRTEFFIGFFCERHREFRVISYVPLVIQHMVTVDEADLTDDKVLQGIQDLRQVGKLGEPRTEAQVAEDQAEADRLAILRDLAERTELIQKIIDARHPNDRSTRLSDVDFENSNETYRKELATHTTEVLRQRVLNIELRRQAAGMSHEDLLAQVRREGGDVQRMQYGGSAATSQAKRRSPNYALDPSYTKERLIKMAAKEYRELCFHSNGQPRYIGNTSVTVSDAVTDRINSLS